MISGLYHEGRIGGTVQRYRQPLNSEIYPKQTLSGEVVGKVLVSKWPRKRLSLPRRLERGSWFGSESRRLDVVLIGDIRGCRRRRAGIMI